MMLVLFAYDGSAFAKRALRYAKVVGPDAQVAVIVVTQVLLEGPHTEQSTAPERGAREAERQLEEARALLTQDGIEAESIHAVGNPAAEIIAAAEERARGPPPPLRGRGGRLRDGAAVSPHPAAPPATAAFEAAYRPDGAVHAAQALYRSESPLGRFAAV